MREQAPGANLLHESVSGASFLVCTEICLPWHDVSPAGQSNWLIVLVPTPQSGCFIIQLPGRVLRVYWLGYLPERVFLERVSGASSLVCTGLYGIKNGFASPKRFWDFQETSRWQVMWKIFWILITHAFVIILCFHTRLIRTEMTHKIFHTWFSFSLFLYLGLGAGSALVSGSLSTFILGVFLVLEPLLRPA